MEQPENRQHESPPPSDNTDTLQSICDLGQTVAEFAGSLRDNSGLFQLPVFQEACSGSFT